MTSPTVPRPEAILFDRDGTLIVNEPYSRDPAAVRAMPGAQHALRLLRRHGFRLGVVSNQSGIGRGMFSWQDLAQVNDRVDELLGPFDDWQICPHTPDDGCACRKPRPGLVLNAARNLGVAPAACLLVGDQVTDIQAAYVAGTGAILVSNAETRPAGLRAATPVVPDLTTVATLLLGTALCPSPRPAPP